MLIIRGINVFPAQVRTVLQEVEKVEPHYQIVLYREGALDQMEVQIEVSPIFLPDAVKQLQGFQRHVEERLRQELGIRPRVRLVEPKTIPDYPEEAGRVIDNRDASPGLLV
jgi:phenylacetate-CoA ligase